MFFLHDTIDRKTQSSRTDPPPKIQWLNFRMLKDEQDCSYNGGGDARPLKTWLDLSSAQYNFLRTEVAISLVRFSLFFAT